MPSLESSPSKFDDLFVVDRICKNFEVAWQQGETPDIETHLAEAPERLCESLLPELLALEVEYRHARGDNATIEEFLTKFPEQHDIITEFWKTLDRTSFVSAGNIAAAENSPTFAGSPNRTQSKSADQFPDLPDYEFLEILGHGGMGVVYKARHKRLGRYVAVKMIAPMRLLPGVMERFQAESEAIAGLQHPNIVQLYEAGNHNGQPFCALEYVAGGNLKKRLQKQRPTPRMAAEMIRTLATAIHHAHSVGIIHRDLKPSNILCSNDGVLKITDFGLAKLAATDKESTRTGEIIGSPLYMSPEQATGKARDSGPVTDVYSLGVILYELLTGRPPFQGESVLDVLHQVKTIEPVPPRRLQPQVPRDLNSICLRCLEKDPVRRYGSADALADDLDRFLESRSTVARPINQMERFSKWTHRNPLAATLLALFVIIGVVAVALITWQWQEARYQKSLADNRFVAEAKAKKKAIQALAAADQANKSALREKKLAEEQRDRAELAKYALQIQFAYRQMQDGFIGHAPSTLAACNPRQKGWEHELLSLVCSQRVTYSPDLGAYVEAAAISPDGRLIAGGCEKAIKVWERGSNEEVLSIPVQKRLPNLILANRPVPMGYVERLLFSPDGKYLAVVDWVLGKGFRGRQTTIQVWDMVERKRVFIAKEFRPAGYDCGLNFDADSKRLAMGTNNVVKIWDVRTGKLQHTLDKHKKNVIAVAFHPDGKRFSSSSADLTLLIWDLPSGKTTGAYRLPKGRVSPLAFSSDGRFVMGAGDNDFRMWLPGKKGIRRLTFKTQSRFAAAISPDSRYLAIGGSVKEADLHHVRIFDIDKDELLVNLQGEGSVVTAMSLDANGNTLVTNGAENKVKIWDLTSTFLATNDLVTKSNMSGSEVLFSPNGKRLVLAGYPNPVNVIDADSGKTVFSIPGQVGTVDVSPDGRLLATAAFTPDSKNSRSDNSGSIRLWNMETGKLVRKLDGHPRSIIYDLLFLGDGSRLASCSEDKTVQIWDVASGKKLSTFGGHDSPVISLAASSGGRLIASSDLRDKRVIIWDAETQKVKHTLHGHEFPIWDMAFAPNGDLIATASERAVKVWNVESGEELFKLSGQARWSYTRPGGLRNDIPFFRGMAFSPDGKRLVAAAPDGHITIWEPAKGQEIVTLAVGNGQIRSLAFSPDARDLVVRTSTSKLTKLSTSTDAASK